MSAIDIKLPPHSIQAEQAVLGGLLLDNTAWDRISDLVTEDDFYADAHRRIFRHISAMCMAAKPADVLTVDEATARSNESELIGGLAYLGELANGCASAANIVRHAQIIADKSLRRRLILAAGQIEGLAFGVGDDARAVVDEAQGVLQALSDVGRSRQEPISFQTALSGAVEAIQDAYDRDGDIIGLATGFADLDAMLNGLQRGDLVLIAGRPSMGKSTIGLNIAENVALSGKHAMVFSLEMGTQQLAMRSLASVGGIDFERVKTGKLRDDDWDRMTIALSKLGDVRLTLDETGGLSVAQILARSRRAARKEGGLDLVVIDYLGLIKPAKTGTTNNRNDEVAQISGALKAMAKELQCPVIALSQLSRKVEERADHRPMMSDLRDSGSLEQDADVIVMMYRDEYYNESSPWVGLAEANIEKHRNGKTGTVTLVFQGQHCRFRDASHEAIAAAAQAAHEAKPVAKKRRFD